MQENMAAVQEKYSLPNVAAGVDGCHFSFREKPRLTSLTLSDCQCILFRNVPDDRDPEQFRNRKGLFIFNAMITGISLKSHTYVYICIQ